MRKVLVPLLGAVMSFTAFVGFTATAGANPPPPTTNQVEYWCPSGGIKYEPVSTPFVVPAPPGGFTWTLLVLKAGSGDGENQTFPNPVVGQAYTRTDGRDISHAILCKAMTTTTTQGTTTVPTTIATTTTPETTTTTIATTTTAPTTSTPTTVATTTTGSTTTTLATTTTAATTTVPQTTTTQGTTTTTVGTTTTQPGICCLQSTTTTAGTTTTVATTVPPTTAPTTVPTTPAPTTVATTVAAVPVAVSTEEPLPVTGFNWPAAVSLAFTLMFLGWTALASVRRSPA